MQYRRLGSTDLRVSAVSMGCWAIGGSWGTVSDETSMDALRCAVDQGVNFFDTADVYGDGRSERLLGKLLKERPERLYVATKAGRRLSPHTADGYTKKNLTTFVERSLTYLGIECIDLLQLHCPPTEVYYRPEVFGALDDLVSEGKVAHYGVSVERVEEGLKALEYSGVQTVQIIFNLFRQRPAEKFLDAALARDVGVLARVPLASGLLSGKLNENSRFEADDHRKFNRRGEAFDVGETFAGVPFEVGVDAASQMAALLPKEASMSQWALRWILGNPGITCAIPGAKDCEQVQQNCRAADLPELSAGVMQELENLYRQRIAPHVHQRW